VSKKSKKKSYKEHAEGCEVCRGKQKWIYEDYYLEHPEKYDEDVEVGYIIPKRKMNMKKWGKAPMANISRIIK